MRTLLKIEINEQHLKESIDIKIKDWLEISGFHPEEIRLEEKDRLRVIKGNNQQLPSKTQNINQDHVIDILLSIPEADDERRLALEKARYLVRYEDLNPNSPAWGIVCIDYPVLSIRWRQRNVRCLEKATEEFVSKVRSHIKNTPTPLFENFGSYQYIPVREPGHTDNVYIGRILPTGEEIKLRAREDKKTERNIAHITFILTLVSLVIGFILFLLSNTDSWIRWLSGLFDRLATTLLATSAISFLNYWLHYKELQNRGYIDWDGSTNEPS